MNKTVADGPVANFGSIPIGSVMNRGTQSVYPGENGGSDGCIVADLYKVAEHYRYISARYWPPLVRPHLPVRNFPFSPRYAHPTHVEKWDSLDWLGEYNRQELGSFSSLSFCFMIMQDFRGLFQRFLAHRVPFLTEL